MFQHIKSRHCIIWGRRVIAAAVAALPLAGKASAGPIARPDHVVIVIEENHDQNQIIGNANAPYINNTLKATGLYYSNAHGTDHDSQPNYLELFSGANPGAQGINSPLQYRYPANINPATDAAAAARENGSDNFNSGQPFSNPNLGASLLGKGFSFAGYSEGLPSAGFTGVQSPAAPGRREYVEKHNPWAQFQGSGANQLPASTNQPLTAFPSDFTKLPTVSFVVPQENNDMHDQVSVAGKEAVGATGKDANGNPVTDATTIQHGDQWLKDNLDAYRQWAQSHNSLLIVTWDENDFNFSRDNNIATLVNGDPKLVQQGGVNDRYVNHFDLLRTVEDMYGLPAVGQSANASDFTFDSTSGRLVAVPLPPAVYGGLICLGGLAGAYGLRMRKARLA